MDMLKLTKKRALELCRGMWLWLAEDGCRAKWEWPDWPAVNKIYGHFEHDCPCCEYVSEVAQGSCTRCPIGEWARRANLLQSKGNPMPPCTLPGSPYFGWWMAQKTGAIASAGDEARRVAQLAIDELKDMMDEPDED